MNTKLRIWGAGVQISSGAPIISLKMRIRIAPNRSQTKMRLVCEILAKLRKYYEQFPKSSSSCNPIVQTVVLDAWRGPNSVQMHSMAELASQTVQLSYDGETQQQFLVSARTNCRSRYHVPAADDDLAPVPSVYPGPTAYRSDALAVASSKANAYLYAARFDSEEIFLARKSKRPSGAANDNNVKPESLNNDRRLRSSWRHHPFHQTIRQHGVERETAAGGYGEAS
jgi:hypothetical protein